PTWPTTGATTWWTAGSWCGPTSSWGPTHEHRRRGAGAVTLETRQPRGLDRRRPDGLRGAGRRRALRGGDDQRETGGVRAGGEPGARRPGRPRRPRPGSVPRRPGRRPRTGGDVRHVRAAVRRRPGRG